MVQLPVNTLPSEEQLQRDPFFSASQTKQSSSEKVELTNKDFQCALKYDVELLHLFVCRAVCSRFIVAFIYYQRRLLP